MAVLRVTVQTLSIFTLSVVLAGVNSLYFPQSKYYGVLSTSHEEGQGLLRLYALKNVTDANRDNVTFYVYDDKNMDTPSASFVIDQSGWLSLAVDTDITSIAGETVELFISAVTTGEDKKAAVSVELTIPSGNDDITCADLCFYPDLPYSYVLEENSGPMVIGRVGQDNKYSSCQRAERSYSLQSLNIPGQNVVEKASEWFLVENRTTEIALLKSLDRESWDHAEFGVKCHVRYNNGTTKTMEKTIQLRVSDVDDNPPVIGNVKSTQQIGEKDWDLRMNPSKKLSLLIWDKDTAGTADYRFDLRGAENHLFRVEWIARRLPKKNRWWQTIFQANVYLIGGKVPKNLMGTTIEVIFEDRSYIKPDAGGLSREVVWQISASFSEEKKTVKMAVHNIHMVNVSRQAAKHTQILNLGKTLGISGDDYHFVYSDKNNDGIFEMTITGGILYVENPVKLRNFPSSTVTVNVKCYDSGLGGRTEQIRVSLTSSISFPEVDCDQSCSFFDTEESCTSSCGEGSSSGRCVMRQEVTSGPMTRKYATCSPNLLTCPDFICDELEKKYHLLCPQDCTESAVGELKMNSVGNRSRGILLAKGPCWCNRRSQCQCWQPIIFNHSSEPDVISVTSEVTKASAVAKKVNRQQYKEAPCGAACKTIIALVLGGVCVAAIVAFSAWCVHRRRKRRTDELRHVGSMVSMNAVPSDYVEERRASHNSIEWSPKFISPLTSYDQKWEFPRKNLVLGKNLGEGEFGQVVKAKAYGLVGKEGYSTVAVKMLKNCANDSEYQDLVSEFNLLKDVNHPNVIKLLGACTKEEPLYIIVEYCDYGSLRHYLRTCRHNNALYMEVCTDNAGTAGQSKPPIHFKLSTRDLLSFAWQISKGMHYLAEMKVVHRDLAARNVLVSSGKLVKISDFGLSRDVYEADAYMKKSKGRIPVKWMAPESLYDQVYTSKSDVWSYGVVLWEIVTLGATPYPGIPPERLFGLLNTGYRMDRPDNCSDELYAVMQKCWKPDPAQRPFFQDLVNITDTMLQAKMEYLDLNAAYRAPFDAECGPSGNGLMPGSPYLRTEEPQEGQLYGKINVVKMDFSSYLTPTSHTQTNNANSRKTNSIDLIAKLENSSRGKTFPKVDNLAQTEPTSPKRRVKLEIEIESEEDISDAKETDSLKCSNV